MAEIKKFLDSGGLTYFCKKFQDYPSNEILGAVINAIDNTKVDKVEGKDLSTNDYTNEDKNKLDSSITFNEQILTDEQQAQARENIRAADAVTMNKLKNELVTNKDTATENTRFAIGTSEQELEVPSMEEFNGLKGEITKCGNIEIDLGAATVHENLLTGSATVALVDNGYPQDKMLILGKNRFPQIRIAAEMPNNGVTMTYNDRYLTMDGSFTAASRVVIPIVDAEGYNTHKLTDLGLKTGDEITIAMYCKKPPTSTSRWFRLVIAWFLNGKQVSSSNLTTETGKDYYETTLTVPENVDAIYFGLSAGVGKVYESEEYFFAMYKTGEAKHVFKAGETTYNLELAGGETVSGVPAPVSIHIKTPTKDYVDGMIARYTPEVDVDLAYYTPEMHAGRSISPNEDASDILTEAIAYAVENRRPFRAFMHYRIDKTITMRLDTADVYIYALYYTGAGYALDVSGSYSRLCVTEIAANNGGGIYLHGKSAAGRTEALRYNVFDIHRINSKDTCLSFYEELSGCGAYNTIYNHFMKSTEGTCLFMDGGGENWFYLHKFGSGGAQAMHLRGEIGYIGTDASTRRECSNNRFFGMTIEKDNVNGILLENAGGNTFENFRVYELYNTYNAEANTGWWLKIKGASGNRFIASTLALDAIDVSEMAAPDGIDAGYTVRYAISTLEAKIIPAGYPSFNRATSSQYYGQKAYITQDGRKVPVPYLPIRRIISEDVDMRTGLELPCTTFEMQADATIYLGDAYCSIGYASFKVIQSEGKRATIYDRGGVLRFDGQALGDGVFRVDIESETFIYDKALVHGNGMRDMWTVAKVE